MKSKKHITITSAIQKVLDKSRRKENTIWGDKGSELYNISIKSWLQDNSIEMYSKYNKAKYVIARRFIRTIKNNIYKYMTSISKNMYIDR